VRPKPAVDPRGIAVQVDPIKPTLKAPGTLRLNLKSDELLSNVAFNFNLRRNTTDAAARGIATIADRPRRCWVGTTPSSPLP
jgi:hypothetical protein